MSPGRGDTRALGAADMFERGRRRGQAGAAVAGSDDFLQQAGGIVTRAIAAMLHCN
jgi:hypothetical protein